jgi:hypothetical protein
MRGHSAYLTSLERDEASHDTPGAQKAAKDTRDVPSMMLYKLCHLPAHLPYCSCFFYCNHLVVHCDSMRHFQG